MTNDIAQQTFVGASGARYDYFPIDEGKIASPVPGNFVIVRAQDGKVIELIHAGQTENLYWVASAVLPGAVINYDGTHRLVRINFDQEARQLEVLDLVQAYDPIMNREDRPQ